MKTMKLTQREFDILEKIDFSDIQKDVKLDRKKLTFEYDNPYTSIYFNYYIVAEGLDDDYDVTDYGIELYQLYDKIFLS